ncbi:uncharacterized protein [Aristolochia californica]|uniref:uncharacterized protein n=1 Tax=Aristolochia californica TaxID=171875 RepID=UPI0035DDAC59
MMGGLGSFGTGSSSTLSPLAPPFTVDRPSSKLNPGLTVQAPRAFGDFADFPPNSSADNWLHLHPPASVSDTESIGYGYSSSHPPRTHLPSVNPAHVLSYDSEVVATNLLGPETYYPPFQVPTETSPAVDFSSKLSGFGYASKWAGSWSGTFEGERKDVDSRLQWQERGAKAIFTNYGTPVSQGGFSPMALAESEEAPGITQEGSFNPFAKTVQLGPRGVGSEWVDFRFSEDNSSCFRPWNGITVTCSDSAIHEPHLPMVGSVSFLNARDHFEPQTSSYARSYSQVDSGAMKPTNSSPEYMLPATSSLLAECSHSYLEKVGEALSKPVAYTDEVHTYKSKEDSLTFVSGNNEACIQISDLKKNYSSDEHGPKQINLTLDFSNNAQKGKHELENSALIHPNSFTFTSGVVCHNDSAQTSSETSDQINHAVDSPCWKGLPTSQHSPFAVAFTVPHVPPIKDVPVSCAPPSRKLIDESEIASSPKLYGSLGFQGHVNNEGCSPTSLPNPSSVNFFPTSEYKSTAADKIRSDYFSSQFENMMQSSGGGQDTGNDSVLFGNTKCGLETSEEVPSSTKKDVVASDLFNGVEGHLSFSDEHVSNKTSSRVRICDEISKLIGAFDAAKSCPALKVDAQVLVKMLHNLSELLLSGHFWDIKSLQEPDYETLDQVINNLSTFALVRKVSEPFLELGGSYSVRKSPKQSHQGNFIGKYPAARSGYDSCRDNPQKSSHVSPTSDKKVNDFQGTFFESKADSQKDIGISQALKKALRESVCDQEETSPRTILYKNLWIQAEAAICHMKYEVQLERMKMVMEGSHYSPAKGTSMCMEKLSAANDFQYESTILGSSDEKKPSESIIHHDYCRQNSVLRESTHEASMNNGVTDVDSSVLARLRILKSRNEDRSSPNDVGMQQISKPENNQDNGCVHETVLPQSCSGRKPTTGMVDGTVPASPCFETKQDVGTTNDPLRDLQKLVIHHAFGNGMSSQSFFSGVEDENVASGKNSNSPQDTTAGNMCQLLISGSNSSGSDWEHILKEDVSWQK